MLIHTVTQKGRGYAPAVAQPELYHGVGRYNPATGELLAGACTQPSYTDVFGKALVEEAAVNDDIIAITAGMTSGTGLLAFKEQYPERFIDTGIAEEHAVALAAGLALGGKKPVVAIYSTFLQRAYDQIATNVALLDLPVVFCVDRAGLVGEDGATHQGAFDLVYLRSLPNMRIVAPNTAEDLQRALHTALKLDVGPIAIRYPRGLTPPDLTPPDSAFCNTEATAPTPQEDESLDTGLLPVGKARKVRDGEDIALLAVGDMVSVALECSQILLEQGIKATVYDMLWVKPLDTEAVRCAAQTGHVVTLENGSLKGGFGSAVLEELVALSLFPEVQTFGLPDKFIEHGKQELLLSELGLTATEIARHITQKINEG